LFQGPVSSIASFDAAFAKLSPHSGMSGMMLTAHPELPVSLANRRIEGSPSWMLKQVQHDDRHDGVGT
jgi:hypothetical protein